MALIKMILLRLITGENRPKKVTQVVNHEKEIGVIVILILLANMLIK